MAHMRELGVFLAAQNTQQGSYKRQPFCAGTLTRVGSRWRVASGLTVHLKSPVVSTGEEGMPRC